MSTQIYYIIVSLMCIIIINDVVKAQIFKCALLFLRDGYAFFRTCIRLSNFLQAYPVGVSVRDLASFYTPCIV